ncbi:MAG: 2Fe-2S iron-sulfur cluster-binding protein, partial [Myxococcota bacterium]
MAKITFEDDDLTVEVADGSELIDVVDDVGATLIFGCTAGHCMVCAVRVRAPSGGATREPDPGARARRDTDTMPGWAGSCWYYL